MFSIDVTLLPSFLTSFLFSPLLNSGYLEERKQWREEEKLRAEAELQKIREYAALQQALLNSLASCI